MNKVANLIDAAAAYIAKAEDVGRSYYVIAGQRLNEARKASPKLWLKIALKKTGKDRATLYRYMQWAADESKHEEHLKAQKKRDVKRVESRKTLRHAQAPASVKPSNVIPFKPVKATPAQGASMADTQKASRLLTSIRQGDFIARECITDLRSLPASVDAAELANAAEQAADAWKSLATQLRRKINAA